MDARIIDKLTVWIEKQVDAAKCKGVVLGMSGGLDSSVTAALCQRAFPKSTLGVVMPCYSSPEDMAHAKLIASRFAIQTNVVVLDTVFDTLLTVLPKTINSLTKSLSQANLKVRLRMLTLYYFANTFNYIVVGSSNKSELSSGYYTKYGDSGVDMLPLGNLVKKEVRELARLLDIPSEILDKPPSAGLWSGQTDEEELGLSYEELDRFLTGHIVSNTTRLKIEGMIASHRHKREVPPIARL